MKYLIILLLYSLTVFNGCNNDDNSKSATEIANDEAYNFKASKSVKIDDGFYLVMNTWEDSSLIDPSGGEVIPYSHDFLEDNTSNQPFFIEVQTVDFVPLSLSKKPKGIEQKDKRINLFLTLTATASDLLEQFTEKHINQKTCIVVGGQAVTMHKIREKITGGKLQITRCTDNACEHLLLELEDNVDQ